MTPRTRLFRPPIDSSTGLCQEAGRRWYVVDSVTRSRLFGRVSDPREALLLHDVLMIERLGAKTAASCWIRRSTLSRVQVPQPLLFYRCGVYQCPQMAQMLQGKPGPWFDAAARRVFRKLW